VGNINHINYRRSQDFSGRVLFFPQKVDDPFLLVAPKNGLKLLNQPLPPPNLHKISKKIDFCSTWGCTWCAWGALTNFPCKLRLNCFLRPGWGVQVYPLYPLATPVILINVFIWRDTVTKTDDWLYTVQLRRTPSETALYRQRIFPWYLCPYECQ